MRTRAAVLRTVGEPAPYAQSKPLHVEDVELAPPGEGEVVVAVRAERQAIGAEGRRGHGWHDAESGQDMQNRFALRPVLR